MPETDQYDRDTSKFIIFHGYIHFLPHDEEEHDNEINAE